MTEAVLYDKLDGKKVRCNLCHHRCIINESKRGICKVRENQNGKLISLVYGKAISTHVDPIEKKPFYHFYPGSYSFSIATVGCNFTCQFCQNYSISQMVRDFGTIQGQYLSPEKIVSFAQKNNVQSISYTYTEPTIFFEYAYDIAVIANERGIKNNFVSNGYMTPEAVDKIAPYLDAINVDLKAMNPKIYKEFCGAKLEGVLETLKYLSKTKIWVEITTLIVPTLNDDNKQIQDAAEFIFSLNPGIPWHISRYHPDYKFFSAPATPVQTLINARETGKKTGLRYIYTGNLFGSEWDHTYCYNCGKKLITRLGFSIEENLIVDSKCTKCGTTIDGMGL